MGLFPTVSLSCLHAETVATVGVLLPCDFLVIVVVVEHLMSVCAVVMQLSVLRLRAAIVLVSERVSESVCECNGCKLEPDTPRS